MQRVIESPIGRIVACATDRGIAELRFIVSPTIRSRAKGLSATTAAARNLDTLERELDEYFAGGRREFSVAIDIEGTPFQARVWQLVRAIPFAETSSYGEIARAAGAPRSARAVGAANGQNRVSLLVPCHRVVGRRGALTGYAWGVDKKAWLLEHEAAQQSTERAQQSVAEQGTGSATRRPRPKSRTHDSCRRSPEALCRP